MKVTLLFSLSLFFVYSTTTAQTVSYSNDAVQLAARVVNSSNVAAEIPEHLIHSIHDALMAVAEDNSQEAYLVAQTHNIHTFKRVNTSTVHLMVDANAGWLTKLLAGKSKIGNVPFTNLLERYNLKVSVLDELEDIKMLEITSDQPMNMKFIANELSMIDDVFMTEVPLPSGDGSDIDIKKVEGGWMITYHLKYDNCESLCKYDHYWQFGVTDASQVSFLGEYGSDLSTYIDKTPNYSVVKTESK
ncbi:MAG: hypothetical protein GY810_12635 [Aureispira sp.]|nr:hypothetical protein [Aureispira sp.]